MHHNIVPFRSARFRLLSLFWKEKEKKKKNFSSPFRISAAFNFIFPPLVTDAMRHLLVCIASVHILRRKNKETVDTTILVQILVQVLISFLAS